MPEETVKIDWNRRARESIAKQQGDKEPEAVHVLEIYDNLTDLSLFAPFKNLKVLRIDQSDSPVARLKSLAALPALPELLELQVADHLLADLPEGFAARYPKLRTLLLSNNKYMSTDAFAPLADCKGLKTLEVDDNPLVAKCHKEGTNYRNVLFELLPSLQVIDGKDKEGNDVASESEGGDDDEEEDEEQEEDEEEDEASSQDGNPEEGASIKRKREEDAAGGDEPDEKKKKDD